MTPGHSHSVDRRVHAFLLACLMFGAHTRASGADPPSFDLDHARRSVVYVLRLTPHISYASGSGFLVRADGVIFTNRSRHPARR